MDIKLVVYPLANSREGQTSWYLFMKIFSNKVLVVGMTAIINR